MFWLIEIQLRLLLIGGDPPWSVINTLLENALRGVPHPYQQQAGLDFDEPFWELFAEKIRKNNSSTPHQERADLDFYEPFSESLGEKIRKNNSSTSHQEQADLDVYENRGPVHRADGSLLQNCEFLVSVAGIQCGAQGGDVLSTTTSEWFPQS